MNRFTALLRGINVSGLNKIAMPDLKRVFEGLGYVDVVTCLNGGKVAFSCETDRESVLTSCLEAAIEETSVYVIPFPLFGKTN